MKNLNFVIFFNLITFLLNLDCEDVDIPPISKSDCHERDLTGLYSDNGSYCCYIQAIMDSDSSEEITVCQAFTKNEIEGNNFAETKKRLLAYYNSKEIKDFDCYHRYIQFCSKIFLVIFFLLF